ncbi:MAG: ectonucleotide pyrophosphatase/phosphodiesterase [Synoicihabitans sp.]
MRALLCLSLLVLSPLFCRAEQPLVILVSIDGCRWDYPEKHDAPFLQRMADEGSRMERLIPSFPTKTFPNHYTLVTGLRPASHGIIQNKFYDPEFDAWFGIGAHPAAREGRWWGGEPIWLTAKRQGLRSACMFWPGAEADILGQHPDEWLRYNGAMTEEARVAQVLEWTGRPAENRPHMITLYFEAVDSQGHRHGPDAVETKLALHKIDDVLEDLEEGLRAQGLWGQTHLIITSDHGMAPKVPEQVVALAEHVDPEMLEIIYLGAAGGVNPKSGSAAEIVDALAEVPHLRAYAKADVPSRLHYSHNARIPEVVLIPDAGWRVLLHRPKAGMGSRDRGDHGYDNREPDMGALFVVRGPNIPAGMSLPPTENVHVYNLLCALLGIEPAPNEGDQRLVARLLQSPSGP